MDRFAILKKIAGLAAMLSVVALIGLGFGSGTAQAKPPHPCCHGPAVGKTIDKNLDRLLGGEKNPLDPFLDIFTGFLGGGK